MSCSGKKLLAISQYEKRIFIKLSAIFYLFVLFLHLFTLSKKRHFQFEQEFLLNSSKAVVDWMCWRINWCCESRNEFKSILFTPLYIYFKKCVVNNVKSRIHSSTVEESTSKFCFLLYKLFSELRFFIFWIYFWVWLKIHI